MPKAKKNEPFNPKDLTPQEQLKFEIAQELGPGAGAGGLIACRAVIENCG